MPPRGRPPKGCVWNWSRGGWDTIEGQPRKPSTTIKKRSRFVVRCAPPPPPRGDDSNVPPAPLPRTDRPPEDRTQPDDADENADDTRREQVDEARQHALWCCARELEKGAFVYYLDKHHDMVEVGKERSRTLSPPEKPLPPKQKRVDKVWGPNEELKLAEGEWELIDHSV